MKKVFVHDNFLLETKTSEILFHEFAEKLPLIDYHNHIDPGCVIRNSKFENISQLWINGDPYKHRAMRIAGIPEKFISGNAPDKEKFLSWACIVPQTIGNPLFHWTCLELKRIFGIDEILCGDSAEKIWNCCNEQLLGNGFGTREILEKWNIDYFCTSDSPIDTLAPQMEFQKMDAPFKVFPSLRNDPMLSVETTFFIKEFEKLTNRSIHNLQEYQEAIVSRLDFFAKSGCLLADHSFDSGFVFDLSSEETASGLFLRQVSGKSLTDPELVQLKSYLLHFLGKEYARRNWILQLHIGAYRSTSTRLRILAGPAGGYACIGNTCDVGSLVRFLDSLEQEKLLPKVILYTLNPADDQKLTSLTGSFSEDGIPCKIQMGPAWWYNDHYEAIMNQLKVIGSYGLLSQFIGMTTDSRSILSFSRHEYFRRILCNLFGEWMEQGKIPNDLSLIGNMVKDISYNNIKKWLSK